MIILSTNHELLMFLARYEISASWWATLLPSPFHEALGRYFAWKVGRKFGRWQALEDARKRRAS